MMMNERPSHATLWVLACSSVLLALSGCTTSRDTTARPTRWDETRLCANLQLANEHIALGKFERAREVLAPFEGFPDSRLRLTEAQMDVEEGQYAAALQRLCGVAASGDTGATYHRLRGVAFEGLGHWGWAAAEYEQAYELEPTAQLLTAWVDTLVLEGQMMTARSVLERERYRFPGQAAVHLLAARLSERIGDNQTAIDELTTAALAEPKSIDIRRRLAELYTKTGHYDEAIVSWQRLVAESRDADERDRLRRRLAWCLVSADRFDEARGILQALVVTRPDDLTTQLRLSAACLMAGEPAEALAAALKVLRAERNNADARLLAALSYRRLGQPAQAAELLSDIQPDQDVEELVRQLRARWE
jgi:tetratricopeptide (TPR) repeat protein